MNPKRLLALLAALFALAGGSSEAAHRVTVTAYNAVRGQTDRTPHLSACGRTRPDQVAVSRDLLRRYPCGTVVYVRTSGGWSRKIVNDTMHPRFRNRVDVLMRSHTLATRYGARVGAIRKA